MSSIGRASTIRNLRFSSVRADHHWPARAAPSSVDFAANGTATAGSDYVAKSGTVNFAAGQNTATVEVTVNGDTTPENNETVFLNLSNATNWRPDR